MDVVSLLEKLNAVGKPKPVPMKALTKGFKYRILSISKNTYNEFGDSIMSIKQTKPKPVGQEDEEFLVHMPNKYDRLLKKSKSGGKGFAFLYEGMEEGYAGYQAKFFNYGRGKNKKKYLTIRKVMNAALVPIITEEGVDVLGNKALNLALDFIQSQSLQNLRKQELLVRVCSIKAKATTFLKNIVSVLAAVFSLNIVKGGSSEMLVAIEKSQKEYETALKQKRFMDEIEIGKGDSGIWVLGRKKEKICLFFKPTSNLVEHVMTERNC